MGAEMAIDSEKETRQLQNRLLDLADRAYGQSMFTFTGFLGLGEQDIFWQMEKELSHAGFELYGGYDGAERKIIRFGSREELGYEEPYPIVCVHMIPLQEKFSDDFSHRDFLGALMNLGIDRSLLGDIRVGHREGWLFSLDSIAGFICNQLEQVRHTRIRCEIVKEIKELPGEEPVTRECTVSSERVDALIARLYGKSRSEAVNLVQAGKVYVNGRLTDSGARLLKSGETVTLRGYGKFIYQGVKSETKKGKLLVTVSLY